MYLNASIQENGNTIVSKTIQNKELYIANKAMCYEDYDSFELEVNKLLKSEQQTIGSDTTDITGTITE